PRRRPLTWMGGGGGAPPGNAFVSRRGAASRGRFEGAGALRRAAPLRLAPGAGLDQRAPYALGVVVLGVDRGAGLLPPRLVQPAGVDAVEAQLVEEPHHDRLSRGGVARHRQPD